MLQRIQILSLWMLLWQNKLEKKATEVSPDQYDVIVDAWKEKDKVAKLLGLYSSRRFYNDWMVAAPVEAERKAANFDILVQKMRKYYAPTENLTLKITSSEP